MARQVYMCVYWNRLYIFFQQTETRSPKTHRKRNKNRARKQQQRVRSTQTTPMVSRTEASHPDIILKRLHNVHTLQRLMWSNGGDAVVPTPLCTFLTVYRYARSFLHCETPSWLWRRAKHLRIALHSLSNLFAQWCLRILSAAARSHRQQPLNSAS